MKLKHLISTSALIFAGLPANAQSSFLMCKSCPANTYSAGGTATSCTDCPANSTAPMGSGKIGDCTCNSGYDRVGDACYKTCGTGTYRSNNGTCSKCADPVIKPESKQEDYFDETCKKANPIPSDFYTKYCYNSGSSCASKIIHVAGHSYCGATTYDCFGTYMREKGCLKTRTVTPECGTVASSVTRYCQGSNNTTSTANPKTSSETATKYCNDGYQCNSSQLCEKCTNTLPEHAHRTKNSCSFRCDSGYDLCGGICVEKNSRYTAGVCHVTFGVSDSSSGSRYSVGFGDSCSFSEAQALYKRLTGYTLGTDYGRSISTNDGKSVYCGTPTCYFCGSGVVVDGKFISF